MENDNLIKSKPKWLRRLERESWQAEMIISGAAIFGSLQLPWLLEQLQYYLLLNYDRGALTLWFFAASYWALFVYSLIVVFIFHFILRALWVGMIGLNSVYTKGFVGNNLSSEDYQQKFRAEYGDVDGFIAKLDRTASGTFGIGFTFACIFFNIGLICSASVVLVSWLQDSGLSQYVAWLIGLTPVIAILALSMLSSVLSLPSLREKEWVKRVHFPLAKLMSSFLYPINTRYITVGLMLLTGGSETDKEKTLVDHLKGFAKFFGICIVIGVALGRFGDMKDQFVDRKYHQLGADLTGTDPKNYASFAFTDLIYEPILSARYVQDGDPFWIWVPLPEREFAEMIANCSVPEPNDELTRREKTSAVWQRNVDCAREYIALFLDEQPITTPEPLREYRASVGWQQFGVRLELSDRIVPPGDHVLRIVTHYPYEEGEKGDWRTTYVHFTVLD